MEGTVQVRARVMAGGVRQDRASLRGPCQGLCGLGVPPGESHRGPVTRVWGRPMGFPGDIRGKEPTSHCRRQEMCLIRGLRRSPGGGDGGPRSIGSQSRARLSDLARVHTRLYVAPVSPGRA